MTDELLDATGLQLIARMRIPTRMRARSIAWHHHNAQPCECPDTRIHSACYRISCLCPRHRGQI